MKTSTVIERVLYKIDITTAQYNILMSRAKKSNLSFDHVLVLYKNLIPKLLYNKQVQVYVIDPNGQCVSIINVNTDFVNMGLVYAMQMEDYAVAVFRNSKTQYDVNYTYAIDGKESDQKFYSAQDCYEALKMVVSKMIEDSKNLGIKEYKGYQFSVFPLKTIGSDFQNDAYVYSVLGLDNKDAWKSGFVTAKEAYEAALKFIEGLEPIDEDEISEDLLEVSSEQWNIGGINYVYNERTNNFVEEDEQEDEDQDLWKDDDTEF